MSEERRAWQVVAQGDAGEEDAPDALPRRPRLGERTLRRVGGRAWQRPNVAVSARLFALYRLPDPWDPMQRPEEEESIRLGPVSLRLGVERRQPAPHLKPKASREKAPVSTGQGNLPPGFTPPAGVPDAGSSDSRLPPGFKPPRGVPDAKTTAEYRPPKPPPRPTTTSSGEFGGKKTRKLVGKIPMRPDLADKAPDRPAAPARSAAKPPPAASTAPEEPKSTWLPPGFTPPRGVPDAKKPSWSPPTPPPRPTTSGEFGSPREHRVVGKLPMRPELSAQSPDDAPATPAAPPISRRPPMPEPAPKKRRGRFRMTPRAATAAPVITEVPESVVFPVAAEPAPEPTPPPAPPRPAIPASAGGLDDLFGFAAQEGRMRLGSRKKD
jgi:hypothetical protein